MIGAISPIEASKTLEGRKKLEDLLSFYESFKSGGIDLMPLSGWVKWRLGIEKVHNGETIYAVEETIFKGDDSPAVIAALFSGEEILRGK